MDLTLLQTMTIIALVSFILGIFVGAMLTRPRMSPARPKNRWDE